MKLVPNEKLKIFVNVGIFENFDKFENLKKSPKSLSNKYFIKNPKNVIGNKKTN